MNIQGISNGMMNVARLGMGEEAKTACALLSLTIVGVGAGYTMDKWVVKPVQLALANRIESHRGNREGLALMVCNFLVGPQATPTKVAPLTRKGAANFGCQVVREAATRIQLEPYKLHAAKFEKKPAGPGKLTTLLKELVGGGPEAVEELEKRVQQVKDQSACGIAYVVKQGASWFIVPIAKVGEYFTDKKSPKALEKKDKQGMLEKFGSSLVEGAQVKVKQEIADRLEKEVNMGAAWVGYTTTEALEIVVTDAFAFQFKNHPLIGGSVSVIEILNADSFSEGASCLISTGVRVATQSSLFASLAYFGSRGCFVTVELIVRACQNQLMREKEEEGIEEEME